MKHVTLPVTGLIMTGLIVLAWCLAAVQVSPAADAPAAPPRPPSAAFELVAGDRVALVGSTLIERAQNYGYIETALTRRYPGRDITFRNLGWSGDTVWGHARAIFDSPREGFTRLIDEVKSTKPTVIMLGYGTNESFDGEAGLAAFLKQLNVLLDDLAPLGARMVILSPLKQEDLGPPLPDPTQHNQDVRRYCDALRDVAAKRGLPFVDLYELLGDGASASPPTPLTDNGMHLTAYGYWRAAAALQRGLGLAPLAWRVEVDAAAKTVTAQGTTASPVEKLAKGVALTLTDDALPLPPPVQSPIDTAPMAAGRLLRVQGLPTGKHALTIDGQMVAKASAAEWAVGVPLARGPEFDQAEQLRKLVLAKNEMFFYRWRPQNITYLFLFRKHEQGQNAREIPQFDPLVAQDEQKIAKLRVPAKHKYVLVPVEGGDK